MEIQPVEVEFRHNGKYKVEDWSGLDQWDCAWAGTNCLVIIADAPERAHADNNDWDQLFDGGNRTFGLDSDLVDGIFTGDVSVHKKERGDDLQVRLRSQ